MTSRPVRIAVQIQPQHASYDQIRDALRRAEDLGVDVAFNWDHFYPLNGAPDGQHFECWTMLAAWAEQTSRIQLGALVTCNSYRNPDLLADMARTVDHISNGRLVLGIGSGWFEKDYEQYGFDFKTAGRRLDDLASALPRIESRLAALNPAPVGPMPVLIGGGGEKKTLRLVAEYADVWHSFGDRETHLRKSDILSDHCADVGRNPLEVEHSVPWPGLENAADLVADGVSLFTVGVSGPDYDLTTLAEAIGWRDDNTPPALSGLA